MAVTRRLTRGNVVDLHEFSRRKRARKSHASALVSTREPLTAEAEIELLNEALTIKVICCYRYRQNYLDALRVNEFVAASEFLRFAHREVRHAGAIAARIGEIGGEALYPLEEAQPLHRSHIKSKRDLAKLIEENLTAKEIVVDTYLTLLEYIKGEDDKTVSLLFSILDDEEDHAGELKALLASVSGACEPARRLHLC